LHCNSETQKEMALLRTAVEVNFIVQQSQEETYAVLPTSQKLVIIYQLKGTTLP
jgi:hypothetical protein